MADSKTTAQKVVDYIGYSTAALEKAGAEIEHREKQAAAVKERIPAVVQALVDHGRIHPHQKEAAAEMLQDPLKALEILEKVAAHRNQQELERIGTPTASTEKKASSRYNSLSDPNVGTRSPRGVKESTSRLFKHFGLPVPAEE